MGKEKSGMCPLGYQSPPLLSRSEATPPLSVFHHATPKHHVDTSTKGTRRPTPAAGGYCTVRGGEGGWNNQPGEDDIKRTKQPVSEKVVYRIGRGLLCTDYRLWSPTMTWDPHIDKMQAGWTEMEDHRAYQDDHG